MLVYQKQVRLVNVVFENSRLIFKEIKMTQANQTVDSAAEYKYTPWEEMSRHEQLSCTFWDAYKDAHGFRPRHVDTSKMTEAQLEAELEYLAMVIKREEDDRIEDEIRAGQRLEETIYKMMDCGCRNREMAIRWLHEAYETNGDTEYLEYNLGVNYGYFSGKRHD
jgi:hypothetical protein